MTMAAAARSLTIIDTDAGFDDLVALRCLLHGRSRDNNNNVLVTTVGGVIDATRAASTIKQLFPGTKNAIFQGKDPPNMPHDPLPDWLKSYRSVNLAAFLRNMGASGDGDVIANDKKKDSAKEDGAEEEGALQAVMDRFKDCDENSVDVLCIGPLTNLAHWLHHHDDDDKNNGKDSLYISKKIRQIYILGGNHPKHSLKASEFNFGLDPLAARQVLEDAVLQDKIRLVTSSVCNMKTIQSTVGKQAVQDFLQTHPSSGDNKTFMGALLHLDALEYSISCDPVCAFCMEHPECVTWERVRVQVQQPSGLLVEADTGNQQSNNDGAGIQIAVKVDLQAYLEWLSGHVAEKNQV